MKIVSEISLADFTAWGGGFETLEELTANLSSEDIEDLETKIMEILDPEDDGITDTELNDFLWFETENIAELLGFCSWEAFLDYGEEEEEEEDVDDEETDED